MNIGGRSAIQSLVFVTGLYAHYQRNMVVEGFWAGRAVETGDGTLQYCLGGGSRG